MKSLRIEKWKQLSLGALLLAAATMTACSSDNEDFAAEQPAEPTTPNTCTLTIKASKGGDATTRALTLDESGTKNVLNATWTEGDKVTVYYMHEQDMGGGYTVSIPTEIGTLTAQSTGASTTLTGEITTTGITIGGMYGGSSETHDLTEGDKLYLSYSGTKGEGGKVYGAEQDGTLQTLADYFDYAGADVTVSSVSSSTVTISEEAAEFVNLSFIIRFTLQDKAGNAISPSSLSINCETTGEYPLVGTQEITIPDAAYTTNGNGVVFVQLQRTNQTTGFSGNITLTATVGDDTYTYEKSGVTFTNGKYYEITVKMKKITDLSMVDCAGNARASRWTANCYMVHTAGKYKLPLVYGNAIKNGQTNAAAYTGVDNANTTLTFPRHDGQAINAPWIKNNGIAVTQAELLWQDAEGLITAVGIDGDYLTLTVGKNATAQEGNALVAAKTADGTIVWSWHIWVTKQTFATLTTITVSDYGYKVTPVNLGWVGDATSGATGYCTFYQWGRKDAFIPSTGIGDDDGNSDNHTVYNISNNDVTSTAFSHTDVTDVTIGGNIQHPTVHYYNTSTDGPCDTKYYNMWDAQQTSNAQNYTAATVKTVYDPCPPGFCVPTSGLYDYIGSQTKPTFNKGYTYSGVFFPASGRRFWKSGDLSLVGTNGYCWSATPSSGYNGRFFFFSSDYWYLNGTSRAWGYPVRAVAE